MGLYYMHAYIILKQAYIRYMSGLQIACAFVEAGTKYLSLFDFCCMPVHSRGLAWLCKTKRAEIQSWLLEKNDMGTSKQLFIVSVVVLVGDQQKHIIELTKKQADHKEHDFSDLSADINHRHFYARELLLSHPFCGALSKISRAR